MLAVTIGVGRWQRVAELSARAARKHTGLPTRILGNAEWEWYKARYDSPHYLKLHLFDLIADHDNLFYFDADAAHINPWTPHDYAGRPQLVAARDEFIGDKGTQIGVPADEYFNSGVMILNRRHHASLLAKAQSLAGKGMADGLHEQPLLNRARILCNVPLLVLDRRYNHLRPFDDPEFNPSQTVIAHYTPSHGKADVVEAFLRSDVILSRRNAAQVAGDYLNRIEPYRGGYAGRGIVICAGGLRYGTCAYVLIRLLRLLGCQLPIQVWYRGAAEHDPAWTDLVEPYGVQCVDAYEVRMEHAHLHLGGWELKPYAVLHSPFREVLLLDADNVPVRDPSFLFEATQYKETGAVFWPDGPPFGSPQPAMSNRWAVFGVEYRHEPEFESGQALIDKARCWKALRLCNWYNEHSYFFYHVVYGDKDTFRFAWRRAEIPYAMPARPMDYTPFRMLQHDFDGNVLFQHRYGDKWSLLGNRRLPGFLREEECLGFVGVLKARWQVAGYLCRDLNPSDISKIRSLGGQRFEFARIGYNRWPLVLGPAGTVAEGWSKDRSYWWVQGNELVIADEAGQPTCSLQQRSNGRWAGRSVRERSVGIELVPST